MSKLSFFNIDSSAILFDFDGVFTDNFVYTSSDGVEMVRCSKSDSLGISQLRDLGVKMFVVSSEQNEVVGRRCVKMGLPYMLGQSNKASALVALAEQHGFELAHSIYVGNDSNDLPAFDCVGHTMAPADSHPSIIAKVDLVLSHDGGCGAVRELTDLVKVELESR